METNRTERKQENKKQRLLWLDCWRGFAVLNMCLYHGLWDLVYYFEIPGFDWYSALPGYVWQQSICWSFIFLSGYSYALGKNKFRRGATILFAGALVEAVAGAFGQEIHYGILSFLGLWQLLLTLPEDWLSREMRLRSWCRIGPLGCALCLGLFFLCRNVNQGSLGFESLKLVTLPGALYRSRLTACLGFPPADFSSLDYVSRGLFSLTVPGGTAARCSGSGKLSDSARHERRFRGRCARGRGRHTRGDSASAAFREVALSPERAVARLGRQTRVADLPPASADLDGNL